MSTAASGLRDLHQLRMKLHDVQQKLSKGPKQIRAHERIVAQKQEAVEEKQQQLKKLKMAADEKVLQLKTNEGKINELNAKLNVANSNREFDIIKSQIDADTMANSVLEDEILEALDKVDQTQSTREALEEEGRTAKAKTQQISEDVAATKSGLEAECSELEAAVKVAETDLPGSVAVAYRRLVQAYGVDALTPVENKACTACYAILSPNSVVELNTGKIVFCPSCGRLLYNADVE